MNAYTFLGVLGDGAFGTVVMGMRNSTGEKVAIKKMKRRCYTWHEAMSLREVQSLKLISHPNVVKLNEVIRERQTLFFIFEYMEQNLYELMTSHFNLTSKSFNHHTVYSIVKQILQGLSFMHSQGYFHRDLKPENLLCSGPENVKIADFGLARKIEDADPCTQYVSTRWYRAPEVLLRSTRYSAPVDLWALGCITAELLTFTPLFPGQSEIDQMFKICSVLGTPNKLEWAEGVRLVLRMGIKLPTCQKKSIETVLKCSSSEASKFISDLIRWNPPSRPSAKQCLSRYTFFTDSKLSAGQAISEQIHSKNVPKSSRPSINCDIIEDLTSSSKSKPSYKVDTIKISKSTKELTKVDPPLKVKSGATGHDLLNNSSTSKFEKANHLFFESSKLKLKHNDAKVQPDNEDEFNTVGGISEEGLGIKNCYTNRLIGTRINPVKANGDIKPVRVNDDFYDFVDDRFATGDSQSGEMKSLTDIRSKSCASLESCKRGAVSHREFRTDWKSKYLR